jgi:hypothetical protein
MTIVPTHVLSHYPLSIVHYQFVSGFHSRNLLQGLLSPVSRCRRTRKRRSGKLRETDEFFAEINGVTATTAIFTKPFLRGGALGHL